MNIGTKTKTFVTRILIKKVDIMMNKLFINYCKKLVPTPSKQFISFVNLLSNLPVGTRLKNCIKSAFRSLFIKLL